VIIKFLKKIIPRLEKPETYSLFPIDCGLHPQNQQTTVGNVAIPSYTVTEAFHRSLWNINKAALCPNPQCNEGLMYLSNRQLKIGHLYIE
jgi:hypothetical protein